MTTGVQCSGDPQYYNDPCQWCGRIILTEEGPQPR